MMDEVHVSHYYPGLEVPLYIDAVSFRQRLAALKASTEDTADISACPLLHIPNLTNLSALQGNQHEQKWTRNF